MICYRGNVPIRLRLDGPAADRLVNHRACGKVRGGRYCAGGGLREPRKAWVMALAQTLVSQPATVLAFTAPDSPADAQVAKTKFLRYINPYCA